MTYRKVSIYAFCFSAIMMICAVGVNADIPNELKAIQKEGHFYYRVDRKVALEVDLGNPLKITNVYHVLPKNSPGSCSNTVAIKHKLLSERMPHISPKVAIYDMKIKSRGVIVRHTVLVILKPGGGYFVLDNQDYWVDEYDDLSGFTNIELMTFEDAFNRYNGGKDVDF